MAWANCIFNTPKKPLAINGMVFYGAMGNSEALSNNNRNLSNNLNVKRTPVAAAAIGGFAELGLTLIGKEGLWAKNFKQNCLIYGRFDYYDTQFTTEGLIFNNPRWERQSWTFGTVYKIIDDVQLKAQYTIRKVGAPAPTSINGGRLERTFVAGFAFEF
ncbi:MAG: hypothetical protein IPN25_15515 [Sphingobacteriales bacterium]|nr:hypothetical protein [Sphingobacteriales bacterium]